MPPRALARIAALALLGALQAGPAAAASRFVLTMSEAANLYVDGQLVHAAVSGPRPSVMLTPGKHVLRITDMAGESLYDGTLTVPDNAEVKASFVRGAGLTITSPVAGVQSGEPDAAEGYVVEDQGEPDTEAVESTFDMNEGTHNPQRSTEDRYAGDAQAWGQAVSTTGRALGTASNVAAPKITTGASTVANAGASMVRNAEAGGIDSLRRGSGNSFRQGRPIPPAAKTGKLVLQHTGEAVMTVYVEGFEVATITEAGKGTVTLEVGTHQVQIWNAETRTLLYEGKLKVEEGFTMPLVFSETEAPVAQERPWLWSQR